MKYKKIDESTFSVLTDKGTLSHNISVPNILRRKATIFEELQQAKKNLDMSKGGKLIVSEEPLIEINPEEQINLLQKDLSEVNKDLSHAKEAGFDV